MNRSNLALSFLTGFLLAGCSGAGSTTKPSIQAADILEPRAQMLKAMDSVTSYRKRMTIDTEGGRFELDAEVACPGRSHYRTARNSRTGYDDYYIDGAQMYFSKGQWQTRQFAGNAPGCPGDQKNGFGPGGINNVVSGRDYLTLQRLSVLADRVKLTKGDTDVVDGVTCQLWEASFKDNFGAPTHVQFFVGINDNLPRRVLVNAPGTLTEIHYWDWNSPLINVNSPA